MLFGESVSIVNKYGNVGFAAVAIDDIVVGVDVGWLID